VLGSTVGRLRSPPQRGLERPCRSRSPPPAPHPGHQGRWQRRPVCLPARDEGGIIHIAMWEAARLSELGKGWFPHPPRRGACNKALEQTRLVVPRSTSLPLGRTDRNPSDRLGRPCSSIAIRYAAKPYRLPSLCCTPNDRGISSGLDFSQRSPMESAGIYYQQPTYGTVAGVVTFLRSYLAASFR